MENITRDEFKQLMRVYSPYLFTIDFFSEKFLKDMKMQFGEIHFTAFVQNGKIVRIESFPVLSQKLDIVPSL